VKYQDTVAKSQIKQTEGESYHGSMTVREMVFIGVGGIVGAGFFLGCGLPIQTAGPSVLIAFLLGAMITSQVMGALTSMTVSHPVRGSFKVYSDIYLGAFAGFIQGWVYYISSLLVISSESVAMGIFSHVWLPTVPVWLMSAVFALLILLLNAFGIQNFGRVESLMSAVKMGALLGFIIFAAFTVFATHVQPPMFSNVQHTRSLFPHGLSGLFQSMLVVIFAYSGIGVFATAAVEGREPAMIDRAATWTMVSLTILYLASVGLLLYTLPWHLANTANSPFVVALRMAHAPLFAEVFNGVILIAAFSVMAGSVFSANQILENLGVTKEAPQFVTRRNKRGTAYGALILTASGVACAITASYLLPANVYNFLISTSSFSTFLNWFLILWTFLRWRKRTTAQRYISRLAFLQPSSSVVTMIVIFVLAGYALLQRDQRIGFYASLAMWGAISVAYVLRRRYTVS